MNIEKSSWAALDAALSRLDISCSDEKKKLLMKHIELVIEKNQVLNLTRIDSIDEAIVLHVEDSLAVFDEFSHTQGEFCDIGTGGGFPGIPLGIVSGRKGILLDSVKKKANAVQGFIECLQLADQLCAVPARSEEFALEEPGRFDTVIARAVASLNVVEELSAPLLSFKGRLVALRGNESKEDEKIALRASESLGFELISQRNYNIGNGAYQRSVYVFEKVGEASLKLPRRPGMALKRPLGV